MGEGVKVRLFTALT